MAADRKPASPYEYYKKLVSDFNALESELQETSLQQKQLQARFYSAKGNQNESDRRKREREAKKWSADRDQQVEHIVKCQAHAQELSQQVDQLEDQEIRLQAELEVLHEKQEAEKMTAAVQLRELIHKRTLLLEGELAKGQVDLEYIAELIDASRNNSSIEKGLEDKAAVQAIVHNIQDTRLRKLEVAKQHLEDQLEAFRRDQQALDAKVDDIRTRKQRALQILSSNQQEAIKDFFTPLADTSTEIDKHERKALFDPSEAIVKHTTGLNYDSILARVDPRANPEALKGFSLDGAVQPRYIEDFGLEAKALIESGADRILHLEQALVQRTKEAKQLDLDLEIGRLEQTHKQMLLKTNWTVDSCPPDLLAETSLAHQIVMECVDKAVTICKSRRPNATSIAQEMFVDALMVRQSRLIAKTCFELPITFPLSRLI